MSIGTIVATATLIIDVAKVLRPLIQELIQVAEQMLPEDKQGAEKQDFVLSWLEDIVNEAPAISLAWDTFEATAKKLIAMQVTINNVMSLWKK